MAQAISFQTVSKSFVRGGRRTVAIEDLSFTIEQGRYVCVLGRSGCGKSTMINLLLGLSKPDRGAVRVLGHDPHDSFDRLKGHIGCVFQNDRLLPWRNAMDNVLLPLEILDVKDADHWHRASQWIERFGLAGFEKAHPSELSGGMRQRVALARALASDPDILLADEAFGHLDAATGDKLRRAFKAVARQGGKTVLHVTHSIDEAIELADQIIVLGRPGRILATFDNTQSRDGAATDALRQDIMRYLRKDGWSEDEAEELASV